jgi:hypothetical protein
MTARAGDRVMAPLARLLLRVFFRLVDLARQRADLVEAATTLVSVPAPVGR